MFKEYIDRKTHHCPVGFDCIALTPPSTGAATQTCSKGGSSVLVVLIDRLGTTGCSDAMAWLLYL